MVFIVFNVFNDVLVACHLLSSFLMVSLCSSLRENVSVVCNGFYSVYAEENTAPMSKHFRNL